MNDSYWVIHDVKHAVNIFWCKHKYLNMSIQTKK